MGKQPPPSGAPFGFDTWDYEITEEDLDGTQRLLSNIPGGTELLAWLGGMASFHDAEVVCLHLERGVPGRLTLKVIGPTAEAHVTFVLSDWIDAEIKGFSQQNVVSELLLREAEERSVSPWERGVGLLSGDHEIILAPTFGAYGMIRATISRIELADLPAEPNS